MLLLKQKVILIFFSLIISFNFYQAQTLSGPRWVLMSIDNLETGVVKAIGDHVRAELWFEGDTIFKGQFCNNYSGKIKTNPNFTCEFLALISGKRQCMGFGDVEIELLRLYPLVNKYKLKGHLLYLFTKEQKRLVFKAE
ncbi:MAG: META domain-containing protein [Bacteroidota bacterium]